MMKKFLAAALVLTLGAGLLAGCSGSSSSDSTGASSSPDSSESSDGAQTQEAGSEDEELAIEVILNTLSSEYWGYVKAGAEAYSADHPNVKVDVVGATSSTSYDEQLNMIETVVTSGGYDGIVISALEVNSAVTVLGDTEIPVVSVNTNLDAPVSLSFVGTGNTDAAKKGGIAAVEAAKAAGWEELNAILIATTQGDPTNEERRAGYHEGVEEAGGTFLEDEIQYGNSVADQAVTCMEAIMENHPEGVAMILSNNDDMAIAAARTAADNEAYANTIFCGFDGIQSACEAIIDGGLTMSIAQDPYGMGYKAVEACVAAIHGETLDEFIDTGCEIITADNAEAQLAKLKEYLGE